MDQAVPNSCVDLAVSAKAQKLTDAQVSGDRPAVRTGWHIPSPWAGRDQLAAPGPDADARGLAQAGHPWTRPSGLRQIPGDQAQRGCVRLSHSSWGYQAFG